ncbi:MAG TPA: hypothetical protein VHX39_07640, partial [Acetobacteraceae bacterium]|nr:hypothetical protein [Acetobacteraceae bacterium]
MSRFVRLFATVVPILLLLATPGCAAAGPPGPTDTTQGWDAGGRAAWYMTSQGSRLIPRSWLDNLEQPDNAGMFLDPAYIQTFRYLPNQAVAGETTDPTCPYDTALPLGFTVDCQSDKDLTGTRLQWVSNQSDKAPWVGMNCSACHTTQMTYKGTVFRADGGPSLADFQSFTAKLARVMHETAPDGPKF